MKTKVSTLAKIFLLLFFSHAAFSQGSIWMAITTNSVNFETNSTNYFKDEYWQRNWLPNRFAVGIPLSNHFKFLPSAAINSIQGTKEWVTKKQAFWDFNLNVAYVILPEKVIEPYVLAGPGVNYINEKTRGIITGGAGVNIWFLKNVGANLQTTYKGVVNHHPYWHNSTGLIFRLDGKPRDSDKDGIPDDQDACPKEKGTAATNGCPDADGDGVKDSDDECPNEAGTAATKGCPDTDNDGIANAKDECPSEAGLAQFNGCPDSDGDGITDKIDNCPKEKGLSQFNGCPDTDGDGIMDKEDECPQQAGTTELKGCPDRDKDGVPDNKDNCPDQAGVAARQGCPEIKAEEVKAIETKLNIAAKRIQFETGSATIKAASFAEIDQIVSIMNQYDFTNFDVEGHTDNTGNADKNKTLSQQRADAVKAYIVSKGVAADRLHALGYGIEKPIASNATVAGRAQNRRVEIHLKQ